MAYDSTKDPYAARSTEVDSQARSATAVTVSDTADLDPYAKALYIGVSGDVTVIPVGNADDAPVLFTAHPVGYMPVQVRRVLSTGTAVATRTGILALRA